MFPDNITVTVDVKMTCSVDTDSLVRSVAEMISARCVDYEFGDGMKIEDAYVKDGVIALRVRVPTASIIRDINRGDKR